MMKPDLKNDARAPLDIDFQMTSAEKRTEVWAKQVKAIEDRLLLLMTRLCKPQPEDKTAELRTEIKVLQGLLKNDPSKEFTLPRAAVEQDELAAGE